MYSFPYGLCEKILASVTSAATVEKLQPEFFFLPPLGWDLAPEHGALSQIQKCTKLGQEKYVQANNAARSGARA